MTTQWRKALAWGIAALSAVLIAAFLAVTLTLPSPVDESGDIYFIVPAVTGMLAFAGVGALIASRTGNPIGWIFLAIAALFSATFVAQSYTDYAVPHGAPLASIARWLANWLLVGALALPVAVFFLYPTGTPASGRWRWVWRVYLVALTRSTRRGGPCSPSRARSTGLPSAIPSLSSRSEARSVWSSP
jgi:hypothetical protein